MLRLVFWVALTVADAHLLRKKKRRLVIEEGLFLWYDEDQYSDRVIEVVMRLSWNKLLPVFV